MRGSGIGSIFSNIFRGLIPLAKGLFKVGRKVAASDGGQRILKAAKQSAINAGIDIAHDALQGENIKQSALKNMKQAKQNVFNSIDEEIMAKRKGGRFQFGARMPFPVSSIVKRKSVTGPRKKRRMVKKKKVGSSKKAPKKRVVKRKKKKVVKGKKKSRKKSRCAPKSENKRGNKKKRKVLKKTKRSALKTVKQVRRLDNLLNAWV